MTSQGASLRTIGAVRQQHVSAIVQQLRQGEVALAASHSTRAEYALKTVRFATIVVTNHRLLIANEPSIGKARVKIAIDLKALRSCGFGPLMGYGPTWEVAFQTADGSSGTMYMALPSEAEDLSDVIRQAVAASL